MGLTKRSVLTGDLLLQEIHASASSMWRTASELDDLADPDGSPDVDLDETARSMIRLRAKEIRNRSRAMYRLHALVEKQLREKRGMPPRPEEPKRERRPRRKESR